MSGGGIGGTLGSLAGVALAPETGGLSLAIPAIAGAGGAYLGGKLTGDKNPLVDALLGGIGGGLGGAINGGENLAGFFDAAPGAAGTGASDLLQGFGPGADAVSTGFGSSPGSAFIPAGVTPANASGAVGANPSILGKLGQYAAKNPLQTALAGNIALTAAQSLMPHPQVNVGQNAANALATNPGFNSQLPKYAMQNTATPYSGNWYTYGETPQTPLYNAQPVLQQAKGGLVGYAQGGRVKGYAMGGMPQGMPAQAPMAPQIPVNPLTLKAAHNVGVAIGKHLRGKISTPDGQVHGQGGGQDDLVPARLSQDEYIIPADVVGHLGDGSSNAGGKALDHLVKKVRHQKAVKGFPPKAKNPLSYLPKKAGS